MHNTLNKVCFQHIDEVSFRSSCFNSEINKLVSVVIKSLKITNNVEEKRNPVVQTILKPLLSKQNSYSQVECLETDAQNKTEDGHLCALKHQKLLDFRDKKLPPSLIMFAQVFFSNIFLFMNFYNN